MKITNVEIIKYDGSDVADIYILTIDEHITCRMFASDDKIRLMTSCKGSEFDRKWDDVQQCLWEYGYDKILFHGDNGDELLEDIRKNTIIKYDCYGKIKRGGLPCPKCGKRLFSKETKQCDCGWYVSEIVLGNVNKSPPINIEPNVNEQIQEGTKYIGFQLPLSHHMAIMNPQDPIHSCTLLLDYAQLVETNDELRSKLKERGWSDQYIAFSTNECGDYFVYDKSDNQIFYADPGGTLSENRLSCEKEGFIFKRFDDWYKHELEQHEE